MSTTFSGHRRSKFVVWERLESRTLLSASALDPSFGAGGVVVTPLGAYEQVGGQAVAPLANGKILVAAEDGPNIAVLQYLPSGKLDGSFGSGGEKIIGFGAGHVGQNLSLSVQSDGRILVAGDDQTTATDANEAFVIRLQTTGALDSTFGSGGELLLHLGVDDGYYSVAAVASGKIVVATSGASTPQHGTFVVKRLDSNGATDTAFGSNGIGTVQVGYSAFLSGIAVQPDGKIVLGGTYYYYQDEGDGIQLARLTANGAPDATFGSNGAVAGTDGYVNANAIALQSDGKIILAGGVYHSNTFALQRFNANGTIDTSFGGAAGAETSFPGFEYGAAVEGVAVESDLGRVIAVGTVDNVLTVVRYTSSGKLDSTFGSNGIVQTSFGANTSGGADAVAIQSSGRIVASGVVTQANGQNAVALVRYLGDHAVLTGGQSAVTTGTTNVADPRLLGTVVASQTLSFSSGSGTSAVKGQVQEWVEQETVGNTLDFYFRIVDASGPAMGIASLLASNFAGFTTYVDYRPDSTGTIAPVSASRSTDGKSITFNFLPAPAGNGDVTPGKQSYALFIKTDATNYDALGEVLLNNSIKLGGYEPVISSAIPKLDSTFNGDGLAPAASPESFSTPVAVAVQSDGKIVFADYDDNLNWYIQRFNSNGSLDVSFGVKGLVTLPKEGVLSAMTLDASGRILLAGIFSAPNVLTGMIVRLNSNGTLDTTFGANGTAKAPSGIDSEFNAIAVQSDGKIVAGGVSYAKNNIGDFTLERFLATGKLDPSFGTAGVAATSLLGFNDVINSVAIQKDGRIVAGGFATSNSTGGNSSFAVARYTAAGQLDTTFGTAGKTLLHLGSTVGGQCVISQLAIDSQGRIVFGGANGDNDGVVVRLTSAGQLDKTFASAGVYALPWPQTDSEGDDGVGSSVDSLLILPGDKILVGGSVVFTNIPTDDAVIHPDLGGSFSDLALAQLTPTGAPDPLFGTDGVYISPIIQQATNNPDQDAAHAISLQGDGKIVAAIDLGVARFTGP